MKVSPVEKTADYAKKLAAGFEPAASTMQDAVKPIIVVMFVRLT